MALKRYLVQSFSMWDIIGGIDAVGRTLRRSLHLLKGQRPRQCPAKKDGKYDILVHFEKREQQRRLSQTLFEPPALFVTRVEQQ